MVNREQIKKVLAKSYIWLMLALMHAPIVALIVLSFTTTKVMGEWSGFSLDNYTSLFDNSEIGTAVLNTLIIALISSVIAAFLGTFAAVGIYNMRRLPKTIMSGANQIPVLNADIVTALSLMIFFTTLGIGSTYVGSYCILIICHVLICTPYVILSVLPRISQLNPDLYEAALDLGATPTGALFKVIMPQLIPGMISGAILAFTLSLDDFVITAYNRGTNGIDTISTYIYDHTKKGTDPAFRALSAIIMLLVLAVLVVLNIRTMRLKNKEKRSK